MATLVSPGVAVSVTDESFYVSAGGGTVPLIVVASGQDKLNAAGDATATGTTKANANKPDIVTSPPKTEVPLVEVPLENIAPETNNLVSVPTDKADPVISFAPITI